MILARAPLRIPLGGGGTDLPSYYSRFGGFFVSAAIDKYVYVSVNRPASDDLIRLKYSQSEEVHRPEELQHDLAREVLTSLGVLHNIEIASMADVSAGTGLGSSGSYIVALLMALHAMKHDHQPRWALAEEASHIEIDLAGHPVGKQDQYVATWGGLHCYEIDASGKIEVTPLRIHPDVLEDLQRDLLLFNTGRTRESASILSRQRLDTERSDPRVIESLHHTKALGYEIKAVLEAGDLGRFGELLHQHWLAKKARLNSITNERVDHMYDLARQAGAVGGKIMGAGGGGFLLLLCAPASSRRVRDAMAAEGFRPMPFDFDLEGAKVLLNV
jgi:D-glycero-alpha-D-manno-heptose-7-phosphate kinase